ncbi:hypothetical protein BDZ89DRAFT_1147688 [Hymenopellis radicata]|nr:hypothetical protein BDZ89DRAFT_1147688 [Hymenopellis radicata]
MSSDPHNHETFIFVRPPPAKSNHPLNFQVQLVPPNSRAPGGMSTTTTPRQSFDDDSQSVEDVPLSRTSSDRSDYSSTALLSSFSSTSSGAKEDGEDLWPYIHEPIPIPDIPSPIPSAHNVIPTTPKRHPRHLSATSPYTPRTQFPTPNSKQLCPPLPPPPPPQDSELHAVPLHRRPAGETRPTIGRLTYGELPPGPDFHLCASKDNNIVREHDVVDVALPLRIHIVLTVHEASKRPRHVRRNLEREAMVQRE